MKDWADRKEIIDRLRYEAENTPDEKTKTYMLNRADEIEKEVELRMIDSPRIVDANSNGIAVRIHPTNV